MKIPGTCDSSCGVLQLGPVVTLLSLSAWLLECYSWAVVPLLSLSARLLECYSWAVVPLLSLSAWLLECYSWAVVPLLSLSAWLLECYSWVLLFPYCHCPPGYWSVTAGPCCSLTVTVCLVTGVLQLGPVVTLLSLSAWLLECYSWALLLRYCHCPPGYWSVTAGSCCSLTVTVRLVTGVLQLGPVVPLLSLSAWLLECYSWVLLFPYCHCPPGYWSVTAGSCCSLTVTVRLVTGVLQLGPVVTLLSLSAWLLECYSWVLLFPYCHCPPGYWSVTAGLLFPYCHCLPGYWSVTAGSCCSLTVTVRLVTRFSCPLSAWCPLSTICLFLLSAWCPLSTICLFLLSAWYRVPCLHSACLYCLLGDPCLHSVCFYCLLGVPCLHSVCFYCLLGTVSPVLHSACLYCLVGATRPVYFLSVVWFLMGMTCPVHILSVFCCLVGTASFVYFCQIVTVYLVTASVVSFLSVFYYIASTTLFVNFLV